MNDFPSFQSAKDRRCILSFCRDIANDLVQKYGGAGAVEVSAANLRKCERFYQRANWRMIQRFILAHD